MENFNWVCVVCGHEAKLGKFLNGEMKCSDTTYVYLRCPSCVGLNGRFDKVRSVSLEMIKESVNEFYGKHVC